MNTTDMTLPRRGARRLAWFALATLLAGCATDESLGTRPDPAGGSLFRTYVAIGTSIGAGLQSGGINDSTQKQAYPYLLATAMGLTPGVDWAYPSFTVPGCPAPYTNILTGARVGGASATACALRSPASVAPLMQNVSIPGIRARQVFDITDTTYVLPDPFKLAQFITGSISPLEMMGRNGPTFVTLEIGANDVLWAGFTGSTTQLTPLADFQASFTTIADSIDSFGAGVAVANVPNINNIPHFSAGVVFFCLKNGGCPAPLDTPQPPYNSANFTVSGSCAPSALGGVGDSMLVAFTATATITQVLSLGGAASLDCGAGTATVTTGAGTAPTGAVITKATTIAIATRTVAINALIQAEATARNWALVDLNGLLDSVRTASPANVPAFPSFTTPSTLFGPYLSLDGIHPNAAAHRLVARRFATALNTRYGTSLTIP
jgi:lysophospholipase L1-like esterase